MRGIEAPIPPGTPASSAENGGDFRMPCHIPFAIAAWCLFAVSFVLPTFVNARGWECALLVTEVWGGRMQVNINAVHFLTLTLANLFMLASPVFILKRRSGRSTVRWVRRFAAASFLLTATFILWFINGIGDIRIGYFVWVLSFALLGMSFVRGAIGRRGAS